MSRIIFKNDPTAFPETALQHWRTWLVSMRVNCFFLCGKIYADSNWNLMSIFSVLDNICPHHKLIFLHECTQRRLRHVPLHCKEVSLGIWGIPAFKAGLRSGGSEKEEPEACWHVEKESAEEEKKPNLPIRGSPAQILLEDPLTLNHTEVPLSHVCK